MNYHIKCSKCPPLADTRVQSFAVVFHSVVNGFLRSMVKTATNQNGESQNGDTKTATR